MGRRIGYPSVNYPMPLKVCKAIDQIVRTLILSVAYMHHFDLH